MSDQAAVSSSVSAGERRLGGIAGVGAALCILTFVVINAKIGGLFSPEVLSGAPIDPWVARVQARPLLAGLGMLAPAVGFFLLFVFGLSLSRQVPRDDWRRTVALSGYALATPIAVMGFLSAGSLVKLIAAPAGATLSEATLAAVELEMNQFMRGSFGVGPLLGIVLGHGGIAWSALRSRALPSWLCYWALFNAGLMSIGTLGLVWPALLVAQSAAPLSMLWMGTTGMYLLLSSHSAVRTLNG